MAQHRPHQVEGLVDVLSRGFSGKYEEMVGGGEMPLRAWDLTSTLLTSVQEVRVIIDFPQVRAAAFPGPDVDSLL